MLGWYNGGARSFFCANKLMTRTEDSAGQKIRVQQSEAYIEMVKLLGATPVVLPYKDVLDGLQKGTVDCAEGNMVSCESTGQYKAAKYMLLDGHMASPEALVVSTKLWDKRVVTARAAVTKDGAQFANVIDFSPYVRRMSPLYSKYMADPAVRGELLEIISNK